MTEEQLKPSEKTKRQLLSDLVNDKILTVDKIIFHYQQLSKHHREYDAHASYFEGLRKGLRSALEIILDN